MNTWFKNNIISLIGTTVMLIGVFISIGMFMSKVDSMEKNLQFRFDTQEKTLVMITEQQGIRIQNIENIVLKQTDKIQEIVDKPDKKQYILKEVYMSAVTKPIYDTIFIKENTK